MTSRAGLIHKRLQDRLDRIFQAVPPISPGPAYWLDSDAGPSYCRPCSIVARGREFELGPLLVVRDSYLRDEWEDAFFDGIDGGFDGESDSAQACAICGKTLSYILTDYGADQELDFYLESPLVVVRDEDSYALDRLCLNIWEGSKKAQLLRAAAVIGQAYRLIGAANG